MFRREILGRVLTIKNKNEGGDKISLDKLKENELVQEFARCKDTDAYILMKKTNQTSLIILVDICAEIVNTTNR